MSLAVTTIESRGPPQTIESKDTRLALALLDVGISLSVPFRHFGSRSSPADRPEASTEPVISHLAAIYGLEEANGASTFGSALKPSKKVVERE